MKEKIKKVIKDVKWMKDIHRQWAEYFEKNPEIEKEYVATGEWDSAKEHRELMADYDNILNVIEFLKKELDNG